MKDGTAAAIALVGNEGVVGIALSRPTPPVVRNVSKRKEIDRHLRYFAQCDLLTQLPNRNLFRDRTVEETSLFVTNSDCPITSGPAPYILPA